MNKKNIRCSDAYSAMSKSQMLSAKRQQRKNEHCMISFRLTSTRCNLINVTENRSVIPLGTREGGKKEQEGGHEETS